MTSTRIKIIIFYKPWDVPHKENSDPSVLHGFKNGEYDDLRVAKNIQRWTEGKPFKPDTLIPQQIKNPLK